MRYAPALVLLVALLIAPHAVRAADGPEHVLFRIFLTDGTPVASYGEFARVGDRVVFSMAVGSGPEGPRLQLVSLPASVVDWQTTERYAESVRREQYVSARAESDFVLLSSEVARVLNEVALTDSPARRLELAEHARNALVEWPSGHFGYRADDLRQMVALLDEVVSEIRASLGQNRFDLSFVAMAEPPPPAPLLPAPTLRETIQQVLRVASHSDSPAEKVSLLQAGLGAVLDDTGGERAAAVDAWSASATRTLELAIDAERRLDREYAELVRKSMARASTRAAAADVRGVEAVLREIRDADGKLGQHRPAAVGGLVRAVNARLEEARLLRLAHDRWTLRRPILRAYRRDTSRTMDRLTRARPLLEEIKALAGPNVGALESLGEMVVAGVRLVGGVEPPEELRDVHAMLTSALNFADNAVRLRRRAVDANDLAAAWDASSSAAASLMLLARATDELGRRLRPPAPGSS